MEAPLPDPITNYNRQVARQRYLRREAHVLIHHPGFNLVYWRRIIRAPARIERLGRHLGWTADQINLTKALLISRMACVFIDHMIYRMEQAHLLVATHGAPHAEWENQYRQFLRLFLRLTEIPDRRAIVKLMQRLHRYTRPSTTLLSFRQRHWEFIEGILAPRLNPEGAAALFARPAFTSGQNPARAAQRIRFHAALFADIQERLHQQLWMFAYSDFMLRLYDQIRKYPEVLTSLVEAN